MNIGVLIFLLIIYVGILASIALRFYGRAMKETNEWILVISSASIYILNILLNLATIKLFGKEKSKEIQAYL